MEGIFVSLFESIGGQFATLVLACVGGYMIISKVVSTIKQNKKEKEKEIADKVHEKDTFEAMKQSILEINGQITDINSAVQTLAAQQDTFVSDVDKKMQNIIDTVTTLKKESKEGDSILETQIRSYEDSINSINMKVSSMDNKTQLLIDSDKEGIKAYITDKYYEAIHKGYIELHVLQGLELRYDKYLKENGNTYIAKMMETIRGMDDKPHKQDSSSKIIDRSVKQPTNAKKWF